MIRKHDTVLAQQELDLLKPDLSYLVWAPYDAVDAAEAMLQVLKDAESENDC